MKLRIAAAVAAATAALAVVASPAYAYVNLRSTGTCNVAGTIWNTTVLYHRDSTSGDVQTYGFNVSRKTGTGTLKEVRHQWTNGSGQDIRIGGWGPTDGTQTSTGGDIPDLLATPTWQHDQTTRFRITSPRTSGDIIVTCSVNVT